jgi:hypothetical protein
MVVWNTLTADSRQPPWRKLLMHRRRRISKISKPSKTRSEPEEMTHLKNLRNLKWRQRLSIQADG